MKVKIEYGTIRQGNEEFKVGDMIDIPESKLPRFGLQVSLVIEESAPRQPETPPSDPQKEPEHPSAEDTGKKKKGSASVEPPVEEPAQA